jgi:hypothetical protein
VIALPTLEGDIDMKVSKQICDSRVGRLSFCHCCRLSLLGENKEDFVSDVMEEYEEVSWFGDALV